MLQRSRCRATLAERRGALDGWERQCRIGGVSLGTVQHNAKGKNNSTMPNM